MWAEKIEGDGQSLRAEMARTFGTCTMTERGRHMGTIVDEIPAFAPRGASLMCLTDGRQAHFISEHLLWSAARPDKVEIFAYSLDHPVVLDEVVDAVVKRGVRVAIYQDARELLGESKSYHGTEKVAAALDRTARAPPPGRLEVFRQAGFDTDKVYRRYDWYGGQGYQGRLHAKVLYTGTYLLMGSSNWSVATEANHEMNVLLKIPDAETRSYVEQYLKRLKEGATTVDSFLIRKRPLKLSNATNFKIGRGKS